MLIIPAIDIIDGKLVRLEKGIFNNQKTYSEDPFLIAEQYAKHGFDIIHIVDLAGSKDGRISIFELLRRVKSDLNIEIQFGGGIRSLEDALNLVEIGIDKIVIGSISITNRLEFEKIINRIGTDKIISAIDTEDELIKVKGWLEKTEVNVYDHISYCLTKGITTFLCTDIKRDGMLKGSNISLYHNLKLKFPKAKIIASGGVSGMDDLKRLEAENIYGVVIGKAIYENKIQLKELSEFAGKKNNTLS